MTELNSNLYNSIQSARQRGFVEDLILNEDGDFISSAQEIVPPVIIEIIPCCNCGATLYLVAGDNKRGTWVHHWEF